MTEQKICCSSSFGGTWKQCSLEYVCVRCALCDHLTRHWTVTVFFFRKRIVFMVWNVKRFHAWWSNFIHWHDSLASLSTSMSLALIIHTKENLESINSSALFFSFFSGANSSLCVISFWNLGSNELACLLDRVNRMEFSFELVLIV